MIHGFGFNSQQIAYYLYIIIPVAFGIGYLTYKFLPQYFQIYDEKRRRQRELNEFLAEYNLINIVELDVEELEKEVDSEQEQEK